MSFLEELFEELAFCLTTLLETANFIKWFFNKQLTQTANNYLPNKTLVQNIGNSYLPNKTLVQNTGNIH